VKRWRDTVVCTQQTMKSMKREKNCQYDGHTVRMFTLHHPPRQPRGRPVSWMTRACSSWPSKRVLTIWRRRRAGGVDTSMSNNRNTGRLNTNLAFLPSGFFGRLLILIIGDLVDFVTKVFTRFLILSESQSEAWNSLKSNKPSSVPSSSVQPWP